MKEKNKEIVQELEKKLQESKSVVFTDYRGLTVNDMNSLRRELNKNGVQYKVVKNTFSMIAAKKIGMENLAQYLEGPTAIAFCAKDEIIPFKILEKFAKTNEALKIKSGLIEGRLIDENQIKAIVSIPSREVLLSKLATLLQSGILGLLFVLQASMRNLLGVLDAKVKSDTNNQAKQ